MLDIHTLFLGSIRLNMGAFFSMSGMIMNLQPRDGQWCTTVAKVNEQQCMVYLMRPPRMKTCSKCDTRPSCRGHAASVMTQGLERHQ